MASKCVHKGCGKEFTDEKEPCVYHPGLPEFHEGQKGWKCCKPRVLTFDEFLAIPPCTTGYHSTLDDTPAPEPRAEVADEMAAPIPRPAATGSNISSEPPPIVARLPKATPQSQSVPSAPPSDSDSDEPSTPIPANLTCKRRTCDGTSNSVSHSRDNEQCIYHPGHPLFHEGSKGWTCCKRRVLEFDEFLKIPGCKTRNRHCFVGKKRRNGEDEEEKLERLATVRSDFYQTAVLIHASFYLKKVSKENSKVQFLESGTELRLDLKTTDGKQYEATLPLFGKIEPQKSSFKILGTKLEVTLAKLDGVGWPVLRADEKSNAMIIQVGRAGRA